MIATKKPVISDIDVQRRAASDALIAAKKQLEAEWQRDQEQQEAAQAIHDHQRGQLAREAINRLSELAGQYDERDRLAQLMVDAISAYFSAESDLRDRVDAIQNSMHTAWVGLDGEQQDRAWSDMRRRASLEPHHARTGARAPHNVGGVLAVTTMVAIARGAIRPGMLVLGNVSAAVDVDSIEL